MKYKRRKIKPSKYIRCNFEKKYKIKRNGFILRLSASAIIVIAIFTAGKFNFVKKDYIKNLFTSDNSIAGEKLSTFVENTAKEVSSVYTQQIKKTKPDMALAKKRENTQVKSDGYDNKEFKITNPCAGRLTSSFGERVHPISGEVKTHNGIDIAAPEGNNVMACADGKVTFSGYNSSSGNYVIIDHGNGYTSSYAHMQKRNCKQDDDVKMGDIIGFIGSTGISTGPHLHFEIRKNGTAVNPRDYIEG